MTQPSPNPAPRVERTLLSAAFDFGLVVAFAVVWAPAIKINARVERTLLSAAFDVALAFAFAVALAFYPPPGIKINPKVNRGGQECPLYT